MGDKKKPKQIDFIVNTGDPSSSAANKKRVRSVAALKSWPERRRKVFAQLESSGSGHGAFLVDEPEPKRKTSASSVSSKASKKIATSQEVLQVTGPSRPSPAVAPVVYTGDVMSMPAIARRSVIADLDHDLAWKYSPEPKPGSSLALYHDALARVPATKQAVDQLHGLLQDDRCHCTQCRYKRNLANPSPTSTSSTMYGAPVSKKRLADGTAKEMSVSMAVTMCTPPRSPELSPSGGRADPFNCYPVPYQPWFDKVLYHMMTVYAPRGWPSLKITNEQGVKWEWYMTQNALAEPALFYVRLLFGSGDMIKLGGLRSEIQFWLRAQAIKCINEAIKDPVRSCSDALILAIGRIALHEHMYGDKYASSHVHRPAQKRMIDMRGGMRKLEIPELVKRLMRWSDRIMAVGSGTPRLLEDDVPNANFSLRESVSAIARWAPHEMPAVRSKIKISDLVNDEENEEDSS